MQDSPVDWAVYRDETLPTIEIVYRGKTTYLTRSKYELNMWLFYCPSTSELLAALTIYVDDLLLSGTAEASEAIWTAIKGKWKISEPMRAMPLPFVVLRLSRSLMEFMLDNPSIFSRCLKRILRFRAL